jgi:hypothetical protein
MLTQQQILEARKQLGISKTRPKTEWSEIDSLLTETPKEETGVSGLMGANVGVIKGGVSTLTGLSSLGERGIKAVGRLLTPKSLEKSFGFEKTEQTSAEKMIPERLRTPYGTAEKIGFGAEQIAEFLIPSSKVAKLEKGMRLLPKALTEGVIVGGQSAIQSGKVDNKTITSAIVGAMFPVGGKLLSKGKGALKPVGEKIQTTVIRPSTRDIKDGFNIANVKKYNVGGSLSDTAIKTHTKINELSQKLAEKLSNSNAAVNLNKVYQETIRDILGTSKSKQFGDIGATKRVIDALKSEIEEVAGKNGLVDLVEATNIKRGAGTKGAWSFGRLEPDSSAIEKVYSKFYSKLKTAIEKAVPDGEIAEINKQISELIPISNAVLRRLPIEQRNNVIGLTDSIGLFSAIFDPRALALIGANRLSKSGRFGNFLVNLAESKIPKTSVGKRIFENK